MSNYIIKDITDKGKGMVATREIRKGELIISEPPLLTYTSAFELVSKINTMSGGSKLKKAFYSLHRQNRGSLGQDIAQSNSLPLGRGAQERGVFRVISRINHACPGAHNADHSWNSYIGKEVIVANQDIASGEEILISYANSFMIHKQRQVALYSGFGFECVCKLCVMSSDDIKERDMILMKLAEYEKLIPILAQPSEDPMKAIELVNRTLLLLTALNMHSHMSSFFYDGFQICAMYSSLSSAQKWAARMKETYIEGEHGQDYVRLTRYKNNPKSHERYGLAGSMKLPPPDF